MTMAPTPLTDACVEEHANEDKNQPHTDWVPAFFSRCLEKRLAMADELLAAIEEVRASFAAKEMDHPAWNRIKQADTSLTEAIARYKTLRQETKEP